MCYVQWWCRKKWGSIQKVFWCFLILSYHVFTLVLLSLSKLLFPLTQVQQIGLVDSTQWKTLPQTSQTDTHKVSRCSFQWLKGAIALVNLSFPSTYCICRNPTQDSSGFRQAYIELHLSARLPHPSGHWTAHIDWMAILLAGWHYYLSWQSCFLQPYFLCFYFYFLCLSLSVIFCVSACLLPRCMQMWAEVCVGYLLLEKQCPCCFI